MRQESGTFTVANKLWEKFFLKIRLSSAFDGAKMFAKKSCGGAVAQRFKKWPTSLWRELKRVVLKLTIPCDYLNTVFEPNY